jgi:hypothetical protein
MDPEHAFALFLVVATWLAVTAAMWTARLWIRRRHAPQNQPRVPSAAGRAQMDSAYSSMFCDASAGQGNDALPCFVCAVRNPAAPKAYIMRKGMRKHIAAYILKGHIRVDACGFCGVAGSCTPSLTGKGASLQPDRQCCAKGYECKFSYGPCLKVNMRSCTNTPMPCPTPAVS